MFQSWCSAAYFSTASSLPKAAACEAFRRRASNASCRSAAEVFLDPYTVLDKAAGAKHASRSSGRMLFICCLLHWPAWAVPTHLCTRHPPQKNIQYIYVVYVDNNQGIQQTSKPLEDAAVLNCLLLYCEVINESVKHQAKPAGAICSMTAADEVPYSV